MYIRSFPKGNQTIQVLTAGGLAPVWSRKGTDLFYRSIRRPLMLVSVTSAPQLTVSVRRLLFDAQRYENRFDVSPDGRFLMMPVVVNEAGGGQIRLI